MPASAEWLLTRIIEVLTNGITATVTGGDIQIGAVEVKDGASDQRARVVAQGLDGSGTDPALAVSDGFAHGVLENIYTADVAINGDTTALVGAVGEVQASPTANTVLDRLKTLSTLIGQVQASPTANTVLDRLKTLATLLTDRLPAALSALGTLEVTTADDMARFSSPLEVGIVTPYAAGDCVGATLDIGSTVLGPHDNAHLRTVILYDADGLGLALDIYFFDPGIAFTSYADNAAFTFAGNDNANQMCEVLRVDAPMWQVTGGTGKVAVVRAPDGLMIGTSGQIMVQVMTPDGGGPYTDASSLVITITAIKN